MESHETDPDREDEAAETPEEFAQEIESDPAHNPDDDELELVRGG
jgi:hypothetical protein